MPISLVPICCYRLSLFCSLSLSSGFPGACRCCGSLAFFPKGNVLLRTLVSEIDVPHSGTGHRSLLFGGARPAIGMKTLGEFSIRASNLIQSCVGRNVKNF